MKNYVIIFIAVLFFSCSYTLNRTSKQDIIDFNEEYSKRPLTIIRKDGSITKTRNWKLDESYLRYDSDKSQKDSVLLNNLHQLRVRSVPQGLLGALAAGSMGFLTTILIIDANESNVSFSSLDNLDQKIAVTFGIGAVSALLGYIVFTETTIVLTESPQIK